MQNPLDDDSLLSGREQDEVTAVDRLTQPFGQVVASLVGRRPPGNAGTGLKQLVDECDRSGRIVGRYVVTDRA